MKNFLNNFQEYCFCRYVTLFSSDVKGEIVDYCDRHGNRLLGSN